MFSEVMNIIQRWNFLTKMNKENECISKIGRIADAGNPVKAKFGC